ncbi:uncharacterized protein LOC116849104 [Odontomachus brunneus]|uniref:uncharacterized protein LOC116849104 n=1 Tax=Odontomachus brunneus TaxID=486640 RepID=UPI0013F25B2D|nr:uncharacterized protein LOC116849104 [Odontomachus brunneus]
MKFPVNIRYALFRVITTIFIHKMIEIEHMDGRVKVGRYSRACRRLWRHCEELWRKLDPKLVDACDFLPINQYILAKLVSQLFTLRCIPLRSYHPFEFRASWISQV